MTSTGKAAEADVAYVDAGETLRQAGHLMRELGVGALRVRGEDGKFQGTISPDMMVRRIAAGGDPKTVTGGEVAAGPADPPGRSRGAAGQRGDHGPDPGSWAWADRVQAWDQAMLDTAASLGADITAIRKPPGLVA
jgi:CBS domain-containing protein